MFLGFCAAPSAGPETLQEKSARLKQEYEQRKKLDAINNNKKKAQQKSRCWKTSAKSRRRSRPLVAIINEQIGRPLPWKEQAIADKQTEIDGRWGGLQGPHEDHADDARPGAVAMIASADSLYDLLTYSTTPAADQRKDNEVLREMSAQKAALEEERQALETAKAEQEAAKAELDKNGTAALQQHPAAEHEHQQGRCGTPRRRAPW